MKLGLKLEDLYDEDELGKETDLSDFDLTEMGIIVDFQMTLPALYYDFRIRRKYPDLTKREQRQIKKYFLDLVNWEQSPELPQYRGDKPKKPLILENIDRLELEEHKAYLKAKDRRRLQRARDKKCQKSTTKTKD